MSHLKRVYKITFPNGKVYLGVESNYGQRRQHHSKAYNNQLVSKAIRSHGWENCSFEYVFESEDYSKCLEKEVELIQFHKSQDPQFGYNITPGGDVGGLGFRHTEESKARISKQWKGRTWSAEKREQISRKLKGHSVSEETRRKIAEKQRAFQARKRGEQ